jgi:hypothetical protein
VRLVPLASPAPRGLLAPTALLALPVPLGLRAFRALLVPLVLRVQRVLASLVPQVLQALPAQRAL